VLQLYCTFTFFVNVTSHLINKHN